MKTDRDSCSWSGRQGFACNNPLTQDREQRIRSPEDKKRNARASHSVLRNTAIMNWHPSKQLPVGEIRPQFSAAS